MEISYKITQGPQSSIILPIVSSEIEGTLIIKVKNKIIFNEENLLLLEFAIYIKQWLDRDEKPNFSYSSMEFEEKNILTFEKEKDDLWRINSVWFNKDQNNIYVMYPELINACTSFINKLKNDFKGITFQY
ncbi:hypothetical protein ABT260_000740 [Acinetobacter baumannii]|uniref:DUF7878 domain-containing protein n=1 Tax=Acinetobacter baumannii TaxID=470 RepID=UPI0004460DE1|nr:hypothetical protein [Acinetobacter baumannii]EXA59447.1 hypothetical protein J521_3735 [Acinetobacter baumannii 1035119]MDC4621010.1 hypothetical protein [Acinetobacter baumannii]MDC4880809.1 hypothetical protein [Acinetobacter baumannii]MDC4888012.1 hypothetical protein [Acinetobacter baumannii]MDC4902595.1 hypothetical protein [Acinetobacter baumannii]